MSSMYGSINRKPQRLLYVDREISKRRQHTISSVTSSKSQRCGDKLKLVLRYNHMQTLCPRPYWPLRNSLKSFAVKLCDLVNLCPWPVLPNVRNFTLIDAIEATKLQPLTTHQRQHGAAEVSRRWARRLVNYFWKQLYFKNFILT